MPMTPAELADRKAVVMAQREARAWELYKQLLPAYPQVSATLETDTDLARRAFFAVDAFNVEANDQREP